MKKRLLALFIAVMMLLSFAACGKNAKTETDAKTQGDAETTAAQQSEEAPEAAALFGEFTSVDMNGEKVDQTVFEGKKVTMVNIWATFCSPCIKEMPDLEKLNKDYADKGFQVVGMVCDVAYIGDGKYDEQLLADAEKVVEQTGVTYRNILPCDALNEAKLSEVYSVPETVFLNEKGEIIGESYIGSRSYEEWANIIESKLAEVEG